MKFTREDLVSFGMYLLSNERRKLFEENPDPGVPLEERLKIVHHADVENYLAGRLYLECDGAYFVISGGKKKINDILDLYNKDLRTANRSANSE